VIRGQPARMLGAEMPNVATHTVRARHEISPKASAFIVARVEAASVAMQPNG